MFLSFITLFLISFHQASGSVDATNTPGSRTAVSSALTLLDKSKLDQTRFTYTRRVHLTSLTVSGAVSSESLRTFDITWINNEAYWRLIQIDDKPLPADLEAKEQKQYDEAVKNRKDFGHDLQARQAHWKNYKTEIDPTDALLTGNIYVEHTDIALRDGVDRVIEVHSGPNTPKINKCDWHYWFWVSGPNLFPVRVKVEADNDPTSGCTSASNDIKYNNVDGLPKMARRTGHFYPNPKSTGLDIDDETFSNYRRFATTVTIGPAHELPGEPSNPSSLPPK